jgi:hypothetical protein
MTTSFGFIPLDTRPVCYDLPQQVAAYSGWQLCCPDKATLATATLKQPVSFHGLLGWLHAVCQSSPSQPLAWVWSTDMVAYGGLIPSRVGHEPREALQQRLKAVLAMLASYPHVAYSSILRIPVYNHDEEEPDYWATYGEALYEFSVKTAQGLTPFAKELPDSVRYDFLWRRQRNHALNQWVQHQQQAGYPNWGYHVFCQDDTGPIGLNVTEAQQLAEAMPPGYGLVQTGADELGLCLLVRLALLHAGQTVKVAVQYGDPDTQHSLLPFDGLPLATVVANKLALLGVQGVAVEDNPDLVWVIHAAHACGDHMEHHPAQGQQTSWQGVTRYLLSEIDQPLLVSDVSYANGGDPELTEWLLCEPCIWQGLYGYAAWNTPGNTLGCSLAMAVARLLAQRQHGFNPQVFNQAMATRLLDDGVYQGIIRPLGQRQGQPRHADWLNQAMTPYAARLGYPDAQFLWPCNRWFEVSINLT